MNCLLTVSVSQVGMVRSFFALLGLVKFCRLVEMVGRLFMITSSVMVVLPRLCHVLFLFRSARLTGFPAPRRDSSTSEVALRTMAVHCLENCSRLLSERANLLGGGSV